jgi:hypothetical protein
MIVQVISNLAGVLGEDFVNRYQQGHPAEGYSEEEVMQQYQKVAGSAPDDIYQQSAEESFARLSPQERKEFFQFLRQRAQQQQGAQDFTDLNQDGADDRYQDPRRNERAEVGVSVPPISCCALLALTNVINFVSRRPK